MDLILGLFFSQLKHLTIPVVSKADICHIALILLELSIHKSQLKTPTWQPNEALLKDTTIAADVLQELYVLY